MYVWRYVYLYSVEHLFKQQHVWLYCIPSRHWQFRIHNSMRTLKIATHNADTPDFPSFLCLHLWLLASLELAKRGSAGGFLDFEIKTTLKVPLIVLEASHSLSHHQSSKEWWHALLAIWIWGTNIAQMSRVFFWVVTAIYTGGQPVHRVTRGPFFVEGCLRALPREVCFRDMVSRTLLYFQYYALVIWSQQVDDAHVFPISSLRSVS